MRGLLSPPKSDAEQAGWWGSGVGEGAEARLRRGLSRQAGQYHAGQAEVRMVEHVEELSFEPKLHMLGQRGTILSDRSHSRRNPGRAGRCGQGYRTGNSADCRLHCRLPVLGSTADANAFGLSHWIVPGWVTPEWGGVHRATRRARRWRTAVHSPCTMPFPSAEYGVLRTENGTPLCQNAVPEICHPFSA